MEFPADYMSIEAFDNPVKYAFFMSLEFDDCNIILTMVGHTDVVATNDTVY